MKKGLSNLANYCRDRNIIKKITGFDNNNVYYEIMMPGKDILTDRVKKNLIKKIKDEEKDIKVHIRFL